MTWVVIVMAPFAALGLLVVVLTVYNGVAAYLEEREE